MRRGESAATSEEPPPTPERARGGRTRWTSALLTACLIVAIVLLVGVSGVAADDHVVSEGQSIQDAVDESEPGDTIVVQDGTYVETVTIDVDGLTLEAAEGHTPVIGGGGITVEATDVTVDGFVIGGDGGISPEWAVRVNDADGFTLVNSTITDNNPNGITIDGSDDVHIHDNVVSKHVEDMFAIGLEYRNGTSLTLTNNTIRENNIGVFVADSETVRFENNTVLEHYNVGANRGDGILTVRTDDVRIENNYFSNDERVREIRMEDANDSVIRSNEFVDNLGPDTIDLFNTPNVRIEENEFRNGSSVLSEMDSKNVTFRENLIDGYGNQSSPGRTTAVTIQAENSLIEHNTVRTGSGNALNVWGDGSTVRNNTFENVMRFGINADSNAVLVENNTLTEIPFASDGSGGDGILLAGDDTVVRNNDVSGAARDGVRVIGTNATVTDLTTTDHERHGVYVAQSEGTALEEITSTGHGEHGIAIQESEGTTVEELTAIDNDGSGVHVQHSPDLELTNSTLVDNRGTGVHATHDHEHSEGPVIVNNTIRYNEAGVTVAPTVTFPDVEPVTATIAENAIQENFYHGVRIAAPAAEVNVTQNSIQHNHRGIVYENDTTVRATENWWGHDTGPSNESGPIHAVRDPETDELADGDGDTVASNVRFDPWLEQALHEQSPRAEFSKSVPFPEPGEEVTFVDESTHPGGLEIVNVHWDFGDGSESGAAEPTVEFDAGTHRVILTVTDADGTEGIYWEDVTVAEVPEGCDWVVTDGVTIQDVLYEADSDDVVCLEDGTYDGEVTVDVDGVTIASAPGHQPVLDGGKERTFAFEVTADDVTIEGLAIESYDGVAIEANGATNLSVLENDVSDGTFPTDQRALRATDSPGLVVQHNEFTELNDGLEVVSSANLTVSDNAFHDGGDVVDAESVPGAVIENNVVTEYDRGVLLHNSTDVRVVNNSITSGGMISSWSVYPGVKLEGGENGTVIGNEFAGLDSGIYVTDTTGTTIEANDVSVLNGHSVSVDLSSDVTIAELEGLSEGSHAIRVSDSSAVTIDETNVHSSSGNGITIQDSIDTAVNRTTATADPDGGGIFDGKGIQIRDSTETDVTYSTLTESGSGVHIWGSTGTLIEYTEIVENEHSIEMRGSHADSIVRKSNLVDNEEGMSAQDAALDARDNWWGADTGPSGDVADPETGTIADGDGDEIIDGVRFDPWLDSPAVPVDLYAAFSFEPATPEPGVEVAFDASNSSSLEGTVTEYRWDFTGDGTVDVTTSDPEATWTYDDADAYEVTLEVDDDAGETAQTTRTVAVSEPEPSVVDYADEETDQVETDGLRDAIDDWRDGDVDTDLLRDVIDAWRSGEEVA